jgi:hypothetical protein
MNATTYPGTSVPHNKVSESPYFHDLEKFIHGVNALKAEYWKTHNFTFNTAPVVMVENVGPKYARLAVYEQSPHLTGPMKATSLYCFFNHQNGDLLKGSWKAPVSKGVRGNVTEPNVLDKFTAHGPKYLRSNTHDPKGSVLERP